METQEPNNLPPTDPFVKHNDALYWLAFAQLPGIGSGRLLKIMAAFPSGEEAWHADARDLERVGFSPEAAYRLLQERQRVDLSALSQTIQGDWTIILFSDERYPLLLKEIADPPPILFVEGSFEALQKPMLAVVGTRRPSRYGLDIVEKLVPPLARAGLTIVSGLAYGIDAAAHEATLKAGGKTVAVLGSGLRRIHPVDHRPLAERIVKTGGAVVSEFAPDTGPETFHFPIRNRIIAGLCLGTLVIEAPTRSGALITASCALDGGREVFAVPGDIDRPQAEGVNALIRDGAVLVRSAEDVLEQLTMNREKTPIPQEKPIFEPRSSEEAAVLKALGTETVPIDLIVKTTTLPTETVSQTLSQLELDGVIEDLGGMTFRRTPPHSPLLT